MKLWRHRNNIDVYEKFVSRCFFRSLNKLKQIPLTKTKFGQNLSQIGALYDFYGQKNLGRQLEKPKFKLDLEKIQSFQQPSLMKLR